jgi:hypothetical protein
MSGRSIGKQPALASALPPSSTAADQPPMSAWTAFASANDDAMNKIRLAPAAASFNHMITISRSESYVLLVFLFCQEQIVIERVGSRTCHN